MVKACDPYRLYSVALFQIQQIKRQLRIAKVKEAMAWRKLCATISHPIFPKLTLSCEFFIQTAEAIKIRFYYRQGLLDDIYWNKMFIIVVKRNQMI